jgi:hypothetical protein
MKSVSGVVEISKSTEALNMRVKSSSKSNERKARHLKKYLYLGLVGNRNRSKTNGEK